MKKTIALFVLIFFSNLLFSQTTFKVIKVYGTIILQKTNMALVKGSIFGENDELWFKNKDAFADVIQRGKGRFILKKNSEDVLYAKANLAPAMPPMPSRSISFVISSLPSLKKHFGKKIFVSDTLALKYVRSNIFFNQEDYLLVKYVHKGDTISKKLNIGRKFIYIYRNELFKDIDDNEEIAAGLYYVDSSIGYERLLSNFIAYVPNFEEVEEELRIVVDEMEGASESKSLKAVMGFIGSNYGKIDIDNARRLCLKIKQKE